MSTKPKRQKITPPSRGDEALDAPQHAHAQKRNKAAVSAPSAEPTDPKQLYGLYSTEYADFCSGAWFPIKYKGPAPPSDGAADGSSSLQAAAASSGADTILVRWASQHRKRYDAEPLAISFVRCAGEFTRLSVENMRPGKRVLVRDVLEDLDFSGVSFWLATIQAQPALHKPAKGKKRHATASQGEVQVEYQNTMWPATSVPLESIYVLPKVKAPLDLVISADSPRPDSDTDHDSEEEEKENQAENESDGDTEMGQGEAAEVDLLAAPSELDAPAAAFLHSSPKLASSPDAFAYASVPMSPPPQLGEETKD